MAEGAQRWGDNAAQEHELGLWGREVWARKETASPWIVRIVRIRRSTRIAAEVELGGIVGKRLLRPTRIAWIADVVAWIAVSAAAIDEQGPLYSRCWHTTL